jgi:hypothetical protein
VLAALLAPRSLTIVGFVAAALAVAAALTWGSGERVLRARAEVNLATLKLEYEQQARASEQAAARQMEALVAQVRQAEKEYRDATDKWNAALAAARSDARGLRQQLQAAVAAAAAAPDPTSALSEQCAARGDLLEDALRLQAELAAAAESHAAAVRALRSGGSLKGAP